MHPIHVVMYPTDFSDRSSPAFAVACALARDYGAELVIVHVSPPPVQAVWDGMVVDLPSGWEEETKVKLQAVRPSGPGIRFSHRFAIGAAAGEIARLAGEVHADLIVMGSHGRGGLSRLLMGSVAEHVMRHAPCPVLTVRQPFPVQPSGAAAALVTRQPVPV